MELDRASANTRFQSAPPGGTSSARREPSAVPDMTGDTLRNHRGVLRESMWWHPTLDADPEHVWLRSVVATAGERL